MLGDTQIKKHHEGQFNSVQLNIVTFIDLEKAVTGGKLEGAYWMMDNSIGSTGQGTEHLQTVCKQGQILNWIIYAMDSDKRAEGTWPPMPRINNIVFLDTQLGDEETVAEAKVCTEFKVYGMPDQIHSELTPVYHYWAGMVLCHLKPGVYSYRFVIELGQDGMKERIFLQSTRKPSLKVLEM